MRHAPREREGNYLNRAAPPHTQHRRQRDAINAAAAAAHCLGGRGRPLAADIPQHHVGQALRVTPRPART